MRAAIFGEYGDSSVLKVGEMPEPHAGPGQVRVKTLAAGVNPFDVHVRAGHLAQMLPLPLPSVPGLDAAGVVDEVGEGARAQLGDRVLGLAMGATAEFAVLTAWAQVPDGVSDEVAAGVPTVASTAIRALDVLGLSAGQTVLIDGAAGGVGTVAVQVARSRGIEVVGTAGPDNLDYLASLGAKPVLYGDGLAGRVAQAAPGGVDGVLDFAGSGSLAELIRIAGDAGRVVSIADHSAGQQGAVVFDGRSGDPTPALETAAGMLADGSLAIRIAATFPLEQIGAAQDLVATGHAHGKVVIRL